MGGKVGLDARRGRGTEIEGGEKGEEGIDQIINLF